MQSSAEVQVGDFYISTSPCVETLKIKETRTENPSIDALDKTENYSKCKIVQIMNRLTSVTSRLGWLDKV